MRDCHGRIRYSLEIGAENSVMHGSHKVGTTKHIVGCNRFKNLKLFQMATQNSKDFFIEIQILFFYNNANIII